MNFYFISHNTIYILLKNSIHRQKIEATEDSWILCNNSKNNSKNIWETTEIEYKEINLSIPK